MLSAVLVTPWNAAKSQPLPELDLSIVSTGLKYRQFWPSLDTRHTQRNAVMLGRCHNHLG